MIPQISVPKARGSQAVGDVIKGSARCAGNVCELLIPPLPGGSLSLLCVCVCVRVRPCVCMHERVRATALYFVQVDSKLMSPSSFGTGELLQKKKLNK